MNTLIGVVYLAVAALGFTGIDLMHTLLNIHTTASSDNFLHLASGLASLYFGTAGASMGQTSPRTA